MRIGLIAIDGCFGSAVASIIDIVRVADGARGDVDPRTTRSNSPSRTETASDHDNSMTLSVDHPCRSPESSTWSSSLRLEPLTAAATNDALQSRDARSVIASLGRLDEATTRIAAACTGVFAVAETGRMHHRRGDDQLVPGAGVPEALSDRRPRSRHHVVVDGNLVTAGAAFAHIDLALSLVRSISPTWPNMSPSSSSSTSARRRRPSSPTTSPARGPDRRRVRTLRARPPGRTVQRRLRRAVARHQPAHPRTTSPCGAQPHSARLRPTASHRTSSAPLSNHGPHLRRDRATGRLRERRDSALPPAQGATPFLTYGHAVAGVLALGWNHLSARRVDALCRPWTTHSTRPQHRPCDVPRLPGRSGLGDCDVAAFASRGSADPIRVDWDEPRRRSGQGGRSRPAG